MFVILTAFEFQALQSSDQSNHSDDDLSNDRCIQVGRFFFEFVSSYDVVGSAFGYGCCLLIVLGKLLRN